MTTYITLWRIFKETIYTVCTCLIMSFINLRDNLMIAYLYTCESNLFAGPFTIMKQCFADRSKQYKLIYYKNFIINKILNTTLYVLLKYQMSQNAWFPSEYAFLLTKMDYSTSSKITRRINISPIRVKISDLSLDHGKDEWLFCQCC